VELVVVLSILALMVAATVPSFKGLKDEQAAREPMDRLKTMAKEARLHAIREKRPYQIVFTEKGFTTTRYLSPYLQLADLDKFIETAQVSEDTDDAARANPAASDANAPFNPNPTQQPNANAFANGSQAAISDAKNAPDPNATSVNGIQAPQQVHPFKEWTDTYTLPEGMNYTVQNWYETTPTQIQGETVKLWVFQPSGMTMPLTVHLERNTAILEASFNALTADVYKETSELR
jgi:type II secretory pathway pseudopilin PulG